MDDNLGNKILQELARIYMSLNEFKAEMYEFKQEMYEFKQEMYEFKQEMYEFKQEMYEFKQEMYKFKQEMYEFREQNQKEHQAMMADLTELISIVDKKHDEKEIALEKRLDKKIKAIIR